jgi:hypothetical protein
VKPANARANIDVTIVKAPKPALGQLSDFGSEYLLWLRKDFYHFYRRLHGFSSLQIVAHFYKTTLYAVMMIIASFLPSLYYCSIALIIIATSSFL